MFLMLMAVIASQQVFADNDSRSCQTVAQACKAAGYTGERNNESKKFWQDCMKPILQGQTVNGVTVDPTAVQTCRTDKIAEMRKKAAELENSR